MTYLEFVQQVDAENKRSTYRRREWSDPAEADATPEHDAEQAAYEAEQERLETVAGAYLATPDDWQEYAEWSAGKMVSK